MAKLIDKQELFCREYLTDLNATQAAIRAGYSKKTARVTAAQSLAKPNIQDRIQELMNKRNERNKIDADYVLKRLIEIDEMDVADILNDDMSIKPVSQWSQSWRRTLQGVDIIYLASNADTETFIKKIKWPDKVKNLELLGKHIKIQAFKQHIVTENVHEIRPLKSLSELFENRAEDGEKTISPETQAVNSEGEI